MLLPKLPWEGGKIGIRTEPFLIKGSVINQQQNRTKENSKGHQIFGLFLENWVGLFSGKNK